MVDRPAPELDEIEIAPEMIKAGKSAFLDYDDDYEFAEDAVVRIFFAMRSVEFNG